MTTNILCICDYGQIRSVGMKCYLNGLQRTNGRIEKLKYDVLTIGSVTSSKKTMKMLKQWADIIIDMRKYLKDEYPHSWDYDLQQECAKIWEKVSLKGTGVGEK
jgi:hypothetical protein